MRQWRIHSECAFGASAHFECAKNARLLAGVWTGGRQGRITWRALYGPVSVTALWRLITDARRPMRLTMSDFPWRVAGDQRSVGISKGIWAAIRLILCSFFHYKSGGTSGISHVTCPRYVRESGGRTARTDPAASATSNRPSCTLAGGAAPALRSSPSGEFGCDITDTGTVPAGWPIRAGSLPQAVKKTSSARAAKPNSRHRHTDPGPGWTGVNATRGDHLAIIAGIDHLPQRSSPAGLARHAQILPQEAHNRSILCLCRGGCSPRAGRRLP